jgi:hypothetical protein
MAMTDDEASALYDEDNYDADPREGDPAKDEAEPAGEPFLAPKSAFPSALEVGSTHTVRVEALHAEEVELVVYNSKKPTNETPKTEQDSMYD